MDEITNATAKAFGKPDMKPFYGASTVVIVSSRKNTQIPNIEYANAACIIQNMLLITAVIAARVLKRKIVSWFLQDFYQRC